MLSKSRLFKVIKENLIFLLVASAAFITDPAITIAKTNPVNPINFTKQLSLSRGDLSPVSTYSVYYSRSDTCTMLVQEMGWNEASCENFENIVLGHIKGIDTLIIEKPNSEGLVKLNDWDAEKSDDKIQAIWDDFVSGSKSQSENLGVDIRPIKWLVYPTVNAEKRYLFYATLIQWGSDRIVNVKASLFDRFGYITFRIVPDNEQISEEELVSLVESTLNSYSPHPQQSYSDFKSGDKIAAAGALGVLASLVGVKYGKAIATGALAVALAFAKKLWFLIFIPFIWVFSKIFRRRS